MVGLQPVGCTAKARELGTVFRGTTQEFVFSPLGTCPWFRFDKGPDKWNRSNRRKKENKETFETNWKMRSTGKGKTLLAQSEKARPALACGCGYRKAYRSGDGCGCGAGLGPVPGVGPVMMLLVLVLRASADNRSRK